MKNKPVIMICDKFSPKSILYILIAYIVIIAKNLGIIYYDEILNLVRGK